MKTQTIFFVLLGLMIVSARADNGDNASMPDPSAESAVAAQAAAFLAQHVPIIDYHIHLRGGMTVEKALDYQAKTGIKSGVLENAGADWPLSDNEKIRQFIDAAKPYPVLVGLQVNDRDWFKAIAPEQLKRLDYVLADTMIMNDEQGKPQKLWLEDQYKIDDPEKWFERYFAHCMTVVNEPVTILANPTYLPKRVAGMYDKFWTVERMTQLIDAAVKNNVAFEIQAGSEFPHENFVKLAKSKGAKFTIGRNNFDDKPPRFDGCFEVMRQNNLGAKEMLWKVKNEK
ncbi:MAG: hypothetical protein FWC50_02340 [Planctomycetaceae bacterium]|nr:hypothetical protein [Planctomycetaceae bacterium]